MVNGWCRKDTEALFVAVPANQIIARRQINAAIDTIERMGDNWLNYPG
jgi:hypothetical protein